MIVWDIKYGGTTPISTLADVLINGSLLGLPSTTGFTIEHNGDTVVFEGSFTLDELLGIAITGGTLTGFHAYSDSLAANVLDASGYAFDVGGFFNGSKPDDSVLPSLIENPMTVNGSAGDDIFYGGPAGDSLFGNGGGDTIYGGTGDDFISGGDGSDALFGGDGYVGQDVGTDTVDYSEKTGALTIALSDDPAVNSVVTVDGVAEDTIASFENANGGSGSDQITGNNFANALVGNAGNDTLTGLGGNDRLDGGLGADTLIGGLGDDTYFVDDIGDVLTEAAGEGTDTAHSAISYALADNVENLALLGTAAVDGTGNALANVFTGNAGNNILSGLEGGDTLNGDLGDDMLAGGIGLDALAGGEGSDTFVFDTKLAKTNIDHVTDFAIGIDHIGLDAGIFKKVNDEGLLKKRFFADGKADDSNDFIVYKEKNGKLFYDRDGDGNAKAKLVAVLDGSPDEVSASDFLIVA